MTSLSTLIYYPRSISLLSSGIFAGFVLSVLYVSVPSIKASKDPLPAFVTTYGQGAKLAINILISSTASGYCYYKTKNLKFLYAALFSAFSIPFTAFFIAPINNQLFALQKDDSYDINKVYGLVDKWAILHGFRAIAGTAAFIINVFM
ncbi:hypothetical protein G6F43_013776 [Rhizopus delemar]|nr:hypothetical protein G6F43_013776 [Rhizopus delemar]